MIGLSLYVTIGNNKKCQVGTGCLRSLKEVEGADVSPDPCQKHMTQNGFSEHLGIICQRALNTLYIMSAYMHLGTGMEICSVPCFERY